ncbi:unknown [Singapore grouper iridovirus]|uniref:FCP1 homology domain-containing protein n=1 Tax=Singapore grouper iridovirus TaxID=262968 RepID=Q5YFK4_9VIRU|nr:hypothetical protein ORF061R [Singapore grouper iridovirus]AAS18076.1 unknown [Singapore grouper iridovirus]WAU86770.1 hypothetical protein ORF061R [Singapore grouper iridovirus]
MAVFLDLDETLIHSVSVRRLGWVEEPYPKLDFTVEERGVLSAVLSSGKPRTDSMRKKLSYRLSAYKRTVIPGFIICWRPSVRWFLNNLFLRGYSINVWTAASEEYAKDVVKALGLSRYNLNIVLSASDSVTKSYKRLTLLVSLGVVDYPLKKMVIVDDREDVKAQQPGRCVRIRPFKIPNAFTPCDERAEFGRVLGKISDLLDN